MPARALIAVEAILGAIAALLAYLLFMGGAADFTRWRHSLDFYGNRQEISWSFPLAGAAVFGVLVGVATWLRGWRHRPGSLLELQRLYFDTALIAVLYLVAFAVFRPPNFSLAIAVVAVVLVLVLQTGLRLGMAHRMARRSDDIVWCDEIRSVPFLVNGALVVLAVLVSLLMAEVILRIHNPFAVRIRGDRIVLNTNYRTVIVNEAPGKLERRIVHTKNSLGFRGEEPFVEPDSRVKLVAVGGSTTEEFYISDDSTWVALMGRRLQLAIPNLWVNNAGLMGHSATAHSLLLEDYLLRLKPAIILFLVGINDLAKDSLSPVAADIQRLERSILRSANNVRPFLDRLADRSELANLVFNLVRRHEAARAGLSPYRARLDGSLGDPPRRQPTPEDYAELSQLLEPSRRDYRQRLQALVVRSRSVGAVPVLITQPLLWGDGVDPDSGMDLASIEETIAGRKTSSLVMWRLLEDYNDVTRTLARDEGVVLVDLARILPKRSALYIDKMHFSVAGASEVGRIAAREVCRSLATATAPIRIELTRCDLAAPHEER